MQATGGYVIIRDPLVRSTTEAHTSALERPVSALDLHSLNTVQATPWRINRWLCDLLAEAFDRCRWHGDAIPGVHTGAGPRLDPRMPDAAWQALTPEERKRSIQVRARQHHEAAADLSNHYELMDKMLVAQELRDRPAIYYPHTRCFRGRIYPLATRGPQPQGNDVSRALLEFAVGMPLGPDGLYWLCVRAANTFGQDKLPLEERVQWSLDHLAEMADCTASPFVSRWWMEADEPWSFLATCAEVVAATSTGMSEIFTSSLPVPMDGSCNGLQHLSAMALDPVGAQATNLRSNYPRQDIYSDIAGRVVETTERDRAAGVSVAAQWCGKVTRDTVKRAVMTTPYGVTSQGIRTQLISDGFTKGLEGSEGEAADYLRDRIVEALGASVACGKAIMGWLQDTAAALATAGLPFDWTTPTGSKVRQAYHQQSRKCVATLAGTFTLQEATPVINGRKQALGAAPNYVHSFDAAHLSMTVAAAHEEGVGCFSMIHDSFGTHAANSTRLSRVLREQFVAIYSEDWLAKTAEEIATYAPAVELPALPRRGAFDIAEVLEAPFFFS